VGRLDGRGDRLPLVGGWAIVNLGLPDPDGADAGLDGPHGQTAVIDQLVTSGFIP
jgi:hypothetical protein